MSDEMCSSFRIVCGSYEGLEKKAVDILSGTLGGCLSYPVPVTAGGELSDVERSSSLVVVGTQASNALLRELADAHFYEPCDAAEGYTIRVAESPFDARAQLIVVAGRDPAGALYGALDFQAYILPAAENTHNHLRYRRKIGEGEAFPEVCHTSAPSVRHRGLWTWGHVVYDIRGYIEHMMRLKLNTLIVWNEYVPMNMREISACAHEHGIRLILGYSWGWNDWFDISDEHELNIREEAICRTYENEYAGLDIDGIYFQSFTETSDEKLHGLVIGEAVMRFVNRVSARLWKRHPHLQLFFGLHATSVSQRLDDIRRIDPRITIVWEDCGAFPFQYVPSDIRGFDETLAFAQRIAALRGAGERFGAVTKGLLCLDWPSFQHQKGRFVLGHHADEFLRHRAEEKRGLWRFVEAYWLRNASYAARMIRAMAETNRDALIVGLVEDGLFDHTIWFPVALFAELLWDDRTPVEDLLVKVAMRPDVEKA